MHRLPSLLCLLALAGCGPRTFTLTMSEDNGSGQNGTATLLDYGDRFTVEVDISPHPVETGRQLIHIHPNRCGNILAPVVALEPLVNGKSFTTVEESLDEYRRADHALNVHLSSNPAVYVSCANIPRL